ncbi:MAG: tRNA 2-thiouridine(34) synthase MnmA [Candidatus Omnitrophota bacterium]
MSKKILVALSGGIDSAVAALLLKESGCDVTAITMSFGLGGITRCSDEAVADAAEVSDQLHIPHKVFNARRELEKHVIADFIAEYANGRTPNPCVRCNEFLKFGLLFQWAQKLGFTFLATGHFARIEKQGRSCHLKKGIDSKKDQSYFLCLLSKKTLSHVVFPLGGMTKEQTQALAKKKGLCVAGKRSSQEVCFIPDNDYRAFLRKNLGAACFKKGEVVDRQGHILGYHQGIVNYTIGQREGFGISSSQALYCLKLDAVANRIIVGPKKDVYSKSLVAEGVNIFERKLFQEGAYCKAKIRYNHPESLCRVSSIKRDVIRVDFSELQSAITPGQFVVFYEKDIVVAGAKIIEVL